MLPSAEKRPVFFEGQNIGRLLNHNTVLRRARRNRSRISAEFISGQVPQSLHRVNSAPRFGNEPGKFVRPDRHALHDPESNPFGRRRGPTPGICRSLLDQIGKRGWIIPFLPYASPAGTPPAPL